MLRESNKNWIGCKIRASQIGTHRKYYEINRVNDTCALVTVHARDLIRMRLDVTAYAVFVLKHEVGRARLNIHGDSRLLLGSTFIGQGNPGNNLKSPCIRTKFIF
jgi:hypothetical protein